MYKVIMFLILSVCSMAFSKDIEWNNVDVGDRVCSIRGIISKVIIHLNGSIHVFFKNEDLMAVVYSNDNVDAILAEKTKSQVRVILEANHQYKKEIYSAILLAYSLNKKIGLRLKTNRTINGFNSVYGAGLSTK